MKVTIESESLPHDVVEVLRWQVRDRRELEEVRDRLATLDRPTRLDLVSRAVASIRGELPPDERLAGALLAAADLLAGESITS